MTTSARRLDRDAITGLEAPPPGGLGTDCFDEADRFMPGDHRQAQQSVELTVILIHVTATDAAGFDPQQRVVGTDPRQVKLLHLKVFVADLDDCSCFGHMIAPAMYRPSLLAGPPSLRTVHRLLARR